MWGPKRRTFSLSTLNGGGGGPGPLRGGPGGAEFIARAGRSNHATRNALCGQAAQCRRGCRTCGQAGRRNTHGAYATRIASMHGPSTIASPPCAVLCTLKSVPIRVPEKQRRPPRGATGERHPCLCQRLGQGITGGDAKARVAVPPTVAWPQRQVRRVRVGHLHQVDHVTACVCAWVVLREQRSAESPRGRGCCPSGATHSGLQTKTASCGERTHPQPGAPVRQLVRRASGVERQTWAEVTRPQAGQQVQRTGTLRDSRAALRSAEGTATHRGAVRRSPG